LSPSERLAAAYDMAERINPSSGRAGGEGDGSPESARRADDDLSGTKSIKSAPGSVSDAPEFVAKSGETIRQALQAEARKLTRA
jgi:hypothetical protein